MWGPMDAKAVITWEPMDAQVQSWSPEIIIKTNTMGDKRVLKNVDMPRANKQHK